MWERFAITISVVSLQQDVLPDTGARAMNEAQLKALLRKTQAAAAAAKPKKNRTYDATLDATRPPQTEAEEAASSDAKDLFQQMKKREF
jgi:hypothetical protein